MKLIASLRSKTLNVAGSTPNFQTMEVKQWTLFHRIGVRTTTGFAHQ